MRNYDGDILGIPEEEAQLLRRQDDEYLRSVHIVPIRPSLLTMQCQVGIQVMNYKLYVYFWPVIDLFLCS